MLYKQLRSLSPSQCGILTSLWPPRRGAWVVSMTDIPTDNANGDACPYSYMEGPLRGIVVVDVGSTM